MPIFRVKRMWVATAAEWAGANPLLQDGDVAIAYDTGALKHGNGVDRWNTLAAMPGGGGQDGADGADGATWRVGSGAPSNDLGVDDDLYLDSSSGDVHRKSSGTYGVVANIRGAPGLDGADGADGVNGVDGADGLNGTNGQDGAQGPPGPAPAGSGLVHVASGVLQAPIALPGTTNVFLRGDGQFAAPAGGSDGESSCFKSTDQQITVAGFVDVAGLTFPVEAGKAYLIEAYIVYRSSATTMGVLIGFNGPAAPARVSLRSRKEITAVATAGTDKFSEAVLSAYNTANPNSTAEIAANADLVNEFQGVFVNGPNAGTFAMRFSKENVAGTATIMTGSWLRYRTLN